MEAKQIIDLLECHDKGEDISKSPWGNHPAVRMWMGYTDAIKQYFNDIVIEWIDRGYKNNMQLYKIKPNIGEICIIRYPPWFGRKDFHDAHKSNLLRKDRKFYSKYNWDVEDDLPYKWG